MLTRSERTLDMQPRKAINSLSEPMRAATKEAIPWYLADDVGKELMSFVKGLASSSTQRMFDTIRHFSLYANTNLFDDPDGDGDGGRVGSDSKPLMTDNQIKIQVDTTAGKLVQANSRINMLTNMGDFMLFRKAKKCEAALQGEWQRMDLYSHLQQVAKDGIICGNGWLKMMIDEQGEVIQCARVFPNQVFVDAQEAAFQAPKKLYQMRYESRDTMISQFPDAAEVIQLANAATPPTFPWTFYSNGMIEICEGWSLPMKGRPGRHVIGCAAGTILDEEWKHDLFPFAHFKPHDLPIGFYGQGLVTHVEAAQESLNQILNIMEEGATLATAPFWIVSQGSNINIKHLDNVPGHIIQATGADPKWITNAPFHQAAPVYCDLLRAIIRDQFGTNSIDTGGEPPINRIDSKRALREYQDMASAHITPVLERWSKKLFVDIAKVTLALASQVAKKKGAYPVLVQENYKRVIQLDWKQLDLKRDAYMLTPAPTNLLSNTPAGKTQDLIEMMQAGLITQKQAQRMMLGPQDVNAMMAEACATEEDIDDLIEGFIDREEYRAPSSLQDLPTGIVRVTDARLLNRVNGCPESTLNLFDRWLSEAEDTIQRLQQQPAPPTPSEGMTSDAGQPPPQLQLPPGAESGAAIAIPAAAPSQPPAVPALGAGGPPSGGPPA